MDNVIIYIHGQGGSAKEAEHFAPLFENSHVIGLDYRSTTPWEAKAEFPKLLEPICKPVQSVQLVANSIGAFLAMHALSETRIDRAFFISPIVNMRKLIEDMMKAANVNENELRKAGIIETSLGQTLSWEYYSYVKNRQINWKIPTHILYGGRDNLTSLITISEFAEQIGATLTVMENGEHWFHTEAQMRFLDRWMMALL